MERTHVIEESKFAIARVSKVDSAGLIEDFKQKSSVKITQEIEPLLNTLFSSHLNDGDKLTLYNDITHGVNVYIYINKEVFGKILNVLKDTNIVTQLKQWIDTITNTNTLSSLPAALKPTISDKMKKGMTKNLEKIYFLRYQAQLLRYLQHLLIVFTK